MASKWNALEGGNAPKFIPLNWADWEGDEHVQDMDETMEGIYFRLIRELWKYGRVEFNYTKLASRIHVKDARRVRTFMEKWGHLFRCVTCGGLPVARWDHAATVQNSCSYCAEGVQCSCSDRAVFVQSPKLSSYRKQASSGESLDDNTIKANRIKANQTRATRDAGEGASVPVLKTTTTPFLVEDLNPSQPESSSPSQTSSTTPFDPRTFRAPVGEFPGDEVRRILDYHFVHHPSPYWTDPVKGKLTSVTRLTTALPTMASQVPEGWTPPVPTAPKPPQTRTVGDPTCRNCRGKGFRSKQDAQGLPQRAPCMACTPRQQVVREGGWVDAA